MDTSLHCWVIIHYCALFLTKGAYKANDTIWTKLKSLWTLREMNWVTSLFTFNTPVLRHNSTGISVQGAVQLSSARCVRIVCALRALKEIDSTVYCCLVGCSKVNVNRMYRLQRILPPKMTFLVRQKVQISSKILPQIPNFASFLPSKKEALSAVNLFYEVLPKQFEAFGFYFSQEKKQATGDCWISGIVNSCSFCLESHCELADHDINHYILQVTWFNLWLNAFSIDLRQILPPKMSFFVRQKVDISSKICPQIPNFANFVKFRQKSIFSSRRPVFFISSKTKSFGAYLYSVGVIRVVCSRPQSRLAVAMNSATNHSSANGQVSHHIPATYDHLTTCLLSESI